MVITPSEPMIPALKAKPKIGVRSLRFTASFRFRVDRVVFDYWKALNKKRHMNAFLRTWSGIIPWYDCCDIRATMNHTWRLVD